MIANGLDIIGYDFVKFVRSSSIRTEINGTDIILYGTNSSDFRGTFEVYEDKPIVDSEFIDIRPARISRIGTISIQPNTVDDIILNVAIVNDSATDIIVNGNSVIVLVNVSDIYSVDLNALSLRIKLVKLAKDPTRPVSNIRNYVIRARVGVRDEFENIVERSISNPNLTSLNFPRYLNKLNLEIKNILTDFDLFIGRKEFDKKLPNTIICTYSEIARDNPGGRGKKLFKKLRRNIMHQVEVTYEFRIQEDYRFLKLYYEMSNYDLVTNITEIEVNDSEGKPWVAAVHWEVDPTDLDLSDVKNGNENVFRTIRAKATIHYFTVIDESWKMIVKQIRMHYNKPEDIYEYKNLPT